MKKFTLIDDEGESRQPSICVVKHAVLIRIRIS